MGWVTEDAPTSAELDACITCGLCLPVCPTFRVTGDETASPRGRLAAMSAVAEGVAAVDETFEEVMGLCLVCRACEVVCPSLVPFGRAMEGARVEIAAQRPSAARRARHAALGGGLGSRALVGAASAAAAMAQRVRFDRIAPGPLGRMRGMRRLPVRPASVVGTVAPARGERIGRAALLAGCVMDRWFAPVHEATIGLLTLAGYDVEVPAAQTCCGALAAHDGAAAEAREHATGNVAAFAGYDVVVADAAGCTAHLKGYGHWAGEAGAELAGRVRDVTEVVAGLIDEGRLPASSVDRGPVAIQDPCHLRHAQRVVAAPRSIVRAAGYSPVEIDPQALCCGAAGIYMTLQPEMSDELGTRKADQVRATGLTLVASANPGCEMQLRSHLGEGYRIAHPVELLWEVLRTKY